MSFADHKITEFTHRITDLPDQPTLSPQELKARFDSSPEELRRAHNAVCDEGERLSARVEGIVTDTFGDTIDREMLSHELAAELDAKAEQTALDAEAAAREREDTDLSTRLTSQISSVNASINTRARMAAGTYTGNTALPRTISLPFSPQTVIVAPQGGGYMRMVLQGDTGYHGGGDIMRLSGSTLTLLDDAVNDNGAKHFWLALA